MLMHSNHGLSNLKQTLAHSEVFFQAVLLSAEPFGLPAWRHGASCADSKLKQEIIQTHHGGAFFTIQIRLVNKRPCRFVPHGAGLLVSEMAFKVDDYLRFPIDGLLRAAMCCGSRRF
jgi:hypothetical protein